MGNINMRCSLTNFSNYTNYISLCFIAFFIAGCAGIGYEKRYVPTSENGWEDIKYTGITSEDYVKFECQDTTVSVSHVWISSRLLATGIIVPIIPAPVSMGSNENFEIDLFIDGKFLRPDKNSLLIQTSNNEIYNATTFERTSVVFRYRFPIIANNTDSYFLIFDEPFSECDMPPLKYEKKSLMRGGITNMGP